MVATKSVVSSVIQMKANYAPDEVYIPMNTIQFVAVRDLPCVPYWANSGTQSASTPSGNILSNCEAEIKMVRVRKNLEKGRVSSCWEIKGLVLFAAAFDSGQAACNAVSSEGVD